MVASELERFRVSFTNGKGFRGEHFKHNSRFEGERDNPSGIPGYFPDYESNRAGKEILSRIWDRDGQMKWKWCSSVLFAPKWSARQHGG